MSGRQSGVSGETCLAGERGRSQSPHSTAAAMSCEKRGKQSRAEGRWAGRWRREGRTEARDSTGSARKGYTRCRSRNRPDWSWVEASVWTERMVSALVNGVKGGRWYSLMDKVYAPATLQAAWARVRANGGAAGVDGQSIERFEGQAELYLGELAPALREGSYRPQPVKRVEIPKGDGRTRPLGIPAVKDRIVQTAVKLVIEPIFEATFCPASYGFRPGLGCKDALREVDRLIEEGYTFVVDADLESYFDTIPHERLMQRIEERISDGRMLALIRSFLDQDILQGLERWTPSGHAARCGDQPAVGQHLPAPAG